MSGKPTYEELEQRVNELGKKVSQTKQTEEALRESEERYRAIFEGAAEGILIADIRTKRFVYANPTICRMLEYTEEELKRMSVGDIHPQEELRNVIFEFEAQAQEKKILAANISCLRKDGTTIYADINTSKVFIDGRECNVGFFSDIAKRKQAEEALWDSNEKLTALFQSSPMAIITLDPDGNVTFWNPAAEKMFGWKEKEVIGRFLPFVPEGKKSEHHALRNRVLSGEGFHNVEALRQKKDGSDIYISISTVPLKDSTGHISGIMSVTVDITERKKVEEALRKSQQIIEGIINAIPARVFWKDKNLVFLGCNALFAHDAGFADPKDIIGKDDYQMVWRDQAELYRGDDRQVIESGCPKLLIEDPDHTRREHHHASYEQDTSAQLYGGD